MSFSTAIYRPTYETKEEGIQGAYLATSEKWKDTALIAVYDIAQKQSFLSSDDVIRVLITYPELEESYRGLAAIFKIAKSNKWIKEARCTCGEECRTMETRRISSHKRRITVYQSLLFTSWN